MRSRIAMIVALLVAVSAAVLGAAVSAGWFSSRTPGWRLRDLGTPAGVRDIAPVAATDNGEILARSYQEGGRGFLWRDGKFVDLGSLGYGGTFPEAINPRGDVVGSSAVGGGVHQAFLWRQGRMIDLGTLGGRNSDAVAINAAGAVAGTSDAFRNGQPEQHAFLWQNGRMRDLGSFGGRASNAIAITSGGDVLGTFVTGTGQHGFLWRHGRWVDLGKLPASVFDERKLTFVRPIAINDQDEIIGYVSDEADAYSTAFHWRDGTMRAFGGPLRREPSVALAINQTGQVLLQTTPGTDKRGDAYLWTEGRFQKLGYLAKRRATFAVALDNNGRVAGRALVAIGYPRPFVWENGQLTALPWLSAKTTPPFGFVTTITDHGEIVGTDFVDADDHTEQHIVTWTRS